MPNAVTFPHPPRLVSETKVLTLLKLKLFVVSFDFSSPVILPLPASLYVSRESNLLLQGTASGFFPFSLPNSCTYLRSQKSCDVVS